MNYIFYLKKQVQSYFFFLIGQAIVYPIAYYFGEKEITIITGDMIITCVSTTLIHFLLGPLYLMYYDSLEGKP